MKTGRPRFLKRIRPRWVLVPGSLQRWFRLHFGSWGDRLIERPWEG